MVMFGAPVQIEMHEMFSHILTHGDTYTPYGATECLPVSNISGSEILSSWKESFDDGKGVCVGQAASGMEIKIIKSQKNELLTLDKAIQLNPFEKGEIIVKGEVATRSYLDNPKAQKMAKIYQAESFWHRMGDMGYLDEQGRLWFLGRVAHHFQIDDETYYSIACEAIFNQHPQVSKSALVKVSLPNGKINPAIVLQRKDRKFHLNEKEQTDFTQEIKTLAEKYGHTKKIKSIFLKKEFPTDVRHNIKIDRKKLSQWASQHGKELR